VAEGVFDALRVAYLTIGTPDRGRRGSYVRCTAPGVAHLTFRSPDERSVRESSGTARRRGA